MFETVKRVGLLRLVGELVADVLLLVHMSWCGRSPLGIVAIIVAGLIISSFTYLIVCLDFEVSYHVVYEQTAL